MPSSPSLLHEQPLEKIRAVLEQQTLNATKPISTLLYEQLSKRVALENLALHRRAEAATRLCRLTYAALGVVFLSGFMEAGTRNTGAMAALLVACGCLLGARYLARPSKSADALKWVTKQLEPLPKLEAVRDELSRLVQDSRACREFMREVRGLRRPLLLHDYEVLLLLQRQMRPDSAA